MLARIWESLFGRLRFSIQFYIVVTIALLLGLPLSMIYSSQVLHFDGTIYGHMAMVTVLLGALAILPESIFRRKCLGPIREYLRARKRGMSLSSRDCNQLYIQISSLPLVTLKWGLFLWFSASIIFAATIAMLDFHTLFAFFALLLGGLLGASLGLSLAYFLFKNVVEPHVVIVAPRLEDPASVAVKHLPFAAKFGGWVLMLVTLGITSFSFMVVGTASTAMERIILKDTVKAFTDIHTDLMNFDVERRDRNLLSYNTSPGRRMDLGILEKDTTISMGIAIELEAEEVDYILTHDRGDSEFLISENVLHFAVLDGGERFLVGRILWDQYRAIPQSISGATMAFAPVLLIFLGLLMYLFARDTSRTLQMLSKFSERIAEGDFREVPAIYADDEMGGLVRQLHTTVNDLNDLVRTVKISGQKVGGMIRTVESSSTEIAEGSNRMSTLLSSSAQSLGSMDSSIQMIVQAVSLLSNNLEEAGATILEMKAILEEIAGNTERLFGSAEHTSASMTQMSSSIKEVAVHAQTMNQQANITELGIKDMDTRIQEIQHSAHDTNRSMVQVRESAERGREIITSGFQGVQDTRDAAKGAADSMLALQGQVEQVDKILNVIGEIAEKTNMLALNASIIAASAGEHGRAFGVVAGQIRELSQRTSVSTQDIVKIIRGIQKGAKRAVDDVENGLVKADKALTTSLESQDAFVNILQLVNDAESMTQRIARATEDLAEGSERATTSVGEMAIMAGSIHSAVQEQTVSADDVALEAEKVREVAFHVKNATEEQAKGSTLITEAIDQIQTDLNQFLQAAQAQAQESQQILQHIQNMTDIASEHQETVERLNAVVADLERSSRTFRGNVDRFRIKN